MSVPIPFCARGRKHVRPRALVQHVEAHHEHLPDRIAQRARKRLVGEIDDRVLSQPDVPDLALLFLRNERGRERIQRVIVLVRFHGMQIEHVDVIGAHHAQRIVEAFDHALRRPPFVVAVNGGFGCDHHLVPRDRFERPADHALGVVGRRGVDEVDAELDRLEDEQRGFVLALCRLQPHPGKAAGAETGDADAEPRAAEGGVVHFRVPTRRPLLSQAVDPPLALCHVARLQYYYWASKGYLEDPDGRRNPWRG